MQNLEWFYVPGRKAKSVVAGGRYIVVSPFVEAMPSDLDFAVADVAAFPHGRAKKKRPTVYMFFLYVFRCSNYVKAHVCIFCEFSFCILYVYMFAFL